MPRDPKMLASQLASELWCMEPSRIEAFFASIGTPIEGRQPSHDDRPRMEIRAGGLGVVPVRGMITRAAAEIRYWWGAAAVSPDEVSEDLRAALEDPRVQTIVLDVDSPGGTISGVPDLADALHAAAQQKKLCAFGDELVCSAAYWLASQADSITTTQATEVGSIGVYRVLYDASRAYEDRGVKVVVVRSGEHKGVGVFGAPLSDAQIAVEQELIDRAADMFIAAVSRGRDMPEDQARQLATGRSWFAAQAVSSGLIDSIGSFEAVTASVDVKARESLREPIDEERTTMTDSERVKQLEAELAKEKADKAKAEAEAAARKVALDEVTATRKQALIEGAISAGRVTPPMREAVAKFAATCGDDVASLETFLSSLPAQTHVQPKGGDAPGAPTPNPHAVSPEEAKYLKRWGVSPSSVEKTNQIAEYRGTKVLLKDGRELPAKDFLGA